MKNIEEIIKEKFSGSIVSIEAGELLFTREEALKVIEVCYQKNTTILGMNFWKKDERGYIEMGGSDYSNISEKVDSPKLSVTASKDLIKDSLPDSADYVSFVFKD